MAPLYNVGGIEEWLRDIAKRLSKKHEITICTTDYLPQKYSNSLLISRMQKINNEVKLGYYEYRIFKRSINRNLVLDTNFLKLVNTHDVAYFENFCLSSLPVFRPLVFGFHVSFRLDNVIKLFLILQQIKRIPLGFHVINLEDYLNLKKFLKQMRMYNGKVFLIPNGVDCDKFNPNAGTLSKRKFRILFMNRLTKIKGVDILPSIVNELLKTGLPFELIIVGPDMGMGYIVKKLVKKFPNNVKYYGYIEHEDTPRLYASSHVTLLPSRVGEKFPLVAIESMACGTPVVTSDLPSFRFILNPLIRQLNGLDLIAKTSDASLVGKHFAETIIKLLTSEQYPKIRRMVREYTMKKFALDKVVSKFEKMLDYVVNM